MLICFENPSERKSQSKSATWEMEVTQEDTVWKLKCREMSRLSIYSVILVRTHNDRHNRPHLLFMGITELNGTLVRGWTWVLDYLCSNPTSTFSLLDILQGLNEAMYIVFLELCSAHIRFCIPHI